MPARVDRVPWRSLCIATIFVIAAILALCLPTSANGTPKLSPGTLQEFAADDAQGSSANQTVLDSGIEARLRSLGKPLGVLGIISAACSTLVFMMVLTYTAEAVKSQAAHREALELFKERIQEEKEALDEQKDELEDKLQSRLDKLEEEERKQKQEEEQEELDARIDSLRENLSKLSDAVDILQKEAANRRDKEDAFTKANSIRKAILFFGLMQTEEGFASHLSEAERYAHSTKVTLELVAYIWKQEEAPQNLADFRNELEELQACLAELGEDQERGVDACLAAF